MSLFELNKRFRKKEKNTLSDKFPEIPQGQLYLQKRAQTETQLQPNLKLIESFQPMSTLNDFSCTSSDCSPRYGYYPFSNIRESLQTMAAGNTKYTGCSNSDIKRYGYCPSNPAALGPQKDAPSVAPIDINAYNANLANHTNAFNKYKDNVQNYVNNPLTGYEGQNVIISQLTGGAIPNPGATPCTPNPCGY